MSEQKWSNFYFRLQKQYNENRPITYELDFSSNQPKPRAAKLMIMITKFVSIFKYGLREGYDNQDDRKENYWSQLCKHFSEDYEINYVKDSFWQPPKQKLKKYFAVLLHTKRIFQVLERIVNEMGYLFVDEEAKRKHYEEEIKPLKFLADGQYKIMGEIVSKYDEYADKKNEEKKIKEIEEMERKKKEEEERRKRELEERRKEQERKEREQREKKEEEERRKVQEKLKQKQKEEQDERIITSDYFPQNYQGGWASPSRKVANQDSSKKLTLPNHAGQTQKLSNSERLFRERYKDELQVFSYALKPQISEDKQNCFECKQPLKKGIYIFGGNQNLCYYTGQWFCNNCISQERMSIPWKAWESFDLRGYTVSKKSHAELKAYYEKPIIQLHKTSPILKTNKILLQFIILKRQLHLMYDSICNVELIDNLMKNKANYCLKIYLFSMKNLYDIYNGQETVKIRKDYQILSKHFYKCPICQKKKGYICPACKDPVKIFPFEIRDTIGCSSCRKLYHRKCLPNGICKCKEED